MINYEIHFSKTKTSNITTNYEVILENFLLITRTFCEFSYIEDRRQFFNLCVFYLNLFVGCKTVFLKQV